MARYAQNTQVSSAKSRMEIEETLMRYGAGQFAYGTGPDGAMIGFTMNDRQIVFKLPMPSKDEKRFWMTPAQRRKRTPVQAYAEWEKACRQAWRALALVIKAKLEAVESGITEFENEFLANIQMADGQVFGDWARPQIAQMYDQGSMPPLLGHNG